MKLSNRGRYALHAMVFLARQNHKGPQTLHTIADERMPAQYLEQLLGQLRRGGLVTSVRGAQGGYTIARPPKEITVADVLHVIEGPFSFSACANEANTCPMDGRCSTQSAFDYLTHQMNNLMHSITLEDIIKQSMPEE